MNDNEITIKYKVAQNKSGQAKYWSKISYLY